MHKKGFGPSILHVVAMLLMMGGSLLSACAPQAAKTPAATQVASSLKPEANATGKVKASPAKVAPSPKPAATATNRTEPTPTKVAPSPTALPKLTLDALKNAEYQSESLHARPHGRKKVKLTNGQYEEEMEWNFPGPAPQFNKLSIFLSDQAAFGDLNGDRVEDAAVILVTNTGGSGFFKELAAVVNDMGMPKHVASVELGDRTKVDSLIIESGKIAIKAIVVGPGDQACCPTHEATAAFRLEADKLIEVD
ncbi:MAG: hypothetical protein ABIH46_09665 [Chloroflexota bacterium]